MQIKGIRGDFLHFLQDPLCVGDEASYQYLEDGLLIIENGKVKDFGSFSTLKNHYKNILIQDYRRYLLLPGFIDTHLHYPQTEMMASFGKQLLDWLQKYTFEVESQFANRSYAQKIADFFLEEMFRNGTTTAMVFGTVHPQSVDVLFERAEAFKMRLIAGKVMMDRKESTPEFLRDDPESSYFDVQSLIQKWHGRGRLSYALTPRFAITSSEEQLKKIALLKQQYPSVYLQTHLSENIEENQVVERLFPWSQGYLDVYDAFDLLGPKTLFAHGVHLTDKEFLRLSQTQSSLAFCPTSNLFLGSGLFRIHQARCYQSPVRLGLGTDVGAGTSFSLLKTINEAYKVAQLQNQTFSAFHWLYLATLGGAQALSLDHYIGNFQPGREADFVVMDWSCTPLQKLRIEKMRCHTPHEALHEKLFSLLMLGDDRNVVATYILGQRVYQRHSWIQEGEVVVNSHWDQRKPVLLDRVQEVV